MRNTAQNCRASRISRRRRGTWELGENPQDLEGVGDGDEDREGHNDDLEGLEEEHEEELAEELVEELVENTKRNAKEPQRGPR